MAHVWNVIDGDIYVSKNGDDVAGDGSMANPYASLNKGFTTLAEGEKIVIGTGIWAEAVAAFPLAFILEGDGNVFFSGDEAYCFYFRIHDSLIHTISFINVSFLNYYTNIGVHLVNRGSGSSIYFEHVFFERQGLVIQAWSGVDESEVSFEQCTIKNLTHVYASITGFYNRCNIIDCTRTLNIVAPSLIKNSIIINSNLVISFPAAYCCIYNCTDVALDSTNITLNPKFNNAEIGDYTLQSDSPCLFAGKNNATIGAFGLGYSFNANSSEFTEESGAIFSQTTLINDIISTSQTINGITSFLFQLATGHLTGNIESTWIDLQSIRYLLITRIFANLIYNASGVAISRPDNLETAGEKTVYYDFELKYCNEESEKAAATFKNVIWNKAVTIDNSDRGNADGAFVASEAKYISARFIKIKLYMTEV